MGLVSVSIGARDGSEAAGGLVCGGGSADRVAVPIVEQVMTELRRSVLSGALAPGRDLSLRELAEMLQVSIIPVREALRSLESGDLVVTRRGRSARVAPLDLGELQGTAGSPPARAGDRPAVLPAAARGRAGPPGAAGGGVRGREPDHERHLRRASRVPPRAARACRHQLGYPHPEHAVAGLGALYPGRLGPPGPRSARARAAEQAHVELVGAFRRRNPEVAAEAVLQHLSRNEQTALLALGSGRGRVAPVANPRPGTGRSGPGRHRARGRRPTPRTGRGGPARARARCEQGPGQVDRARAAARPGRGPPARSPPPAPGRRTSSVNPSPSSSYSDRPGPSQACGSSAPCCPLLAPRVRLAGDDR